MRIAAGLDLIVAFVPLFAVLIACAAWERIAPALAAVDDVVYNTAEVERSCKFGTAELKNILARQWAAMDWQSVVVRCL